MYEGGIRVPLVVKWPGVVVAGGKTDHVSAFCDFLPTFSEVLNRDFVEPTDGVSMLPTLANNKKAQRQHEFLYWEFPAKGGRKALRMGKWKLVIYDVKKHAYKNCALYDVEMDIEELKDLSTQYPKVVDKMIEIMAAESTPSSLFPFPAPQ